MSTHPEYIAHIERQLGNKANIRPMFGGHTLYYESKVVGLICDNTLFVKVTPGTERLLGKGEKGHPYEGAKEAFVIDESTVSNKNQLLKIITCCAADVKIKPPRKKKKK